MCNFAAENNYNDMIGRTIATDIEKDFQSGKIIVITGARQVGKTTLLEDFASRFSKVLKLNCDNYDDRLDLENRRSTELRNLIGNSDFMMIDEAQRVNNIGLTLKMLADLKLNIPILVTGSSSFELNNAINEAATGRFFDYRMYPFSFSELANHTSQRDEGRLLEQRILYGSYPDVVNHPEDARRIVTNLANNYLYRDLLEYKGMKKPELLQKLVRALALQIGSEVSYNELAKTLGADKETIENYIDLLEKCFVVFRLSSFSRNMRTEIRKGKKIYFYDNGIRNALIANFAPLELRTDKGALWENYLLSERIKKLRNTGDYSQCYFWRTNTQQEIDLIEECDGKMRAYKFKWKDEKAKMPAIFAETYSEATFQVINTVNYQDWLK